MQFHKTWNTSFDQIFKAQSLLEKNNEIFERPSTYESTRRPVNRKPGTSRVFQLDQLIRMITEKQYRAKSQILTIYTLEQLPNVCLKKYRESVYYGQFVNNSREGLGVMVYTNGRAYQGYWLNNFKHGKGYEKYDNGAQYEGNYKEGKPSGYGRYSWQNGELYEGQWEDGMKNGSGMWRGPSGDSYIGEWKNGQANGYGVHTWINGDRYEGQFIDCLKHGEGIQKFNNGDSYKGMYQNGKPEGYGEYYWSVGSFFKGTFKNGLREGNGIWKSGPGNSDKYEGEYKEDKKEGYGVFIWSNGNAYKGNFKNDLREGYGEMVWSDGRIYKGNWHEGMQVGGESHAIEPDYNQQGIQPEQLQNQDDFYNEETQDLIPMGINPNINKGIEVYQNPKVSSSYNSNRWQPRNNLSSQRELFAAKRMKFNHQPEYFQSAKDLNQFDYEQNRQEGPEQSHFQKRFIPQKYPIKNSPYLLSNTRNHHHNIYNSPNYPIVHSQNKRFRSRNSSKKSQNYLPEKSSEKSTDKQFVRNTPNQKIFFDNNFVENGQNSKKIISKRKNLNETEPLFNHSVRLRNNASSESCKKKVRNQNVSSSQSGRNASEKMMMSSTFFLYKIHGKNREGEGSHVKNRRAVKTSGGIRSKGRVENAQYYQEHVLGRQY